MTLITYILNRHRHLGDPKPVKMLREAKAKEAARKKGKK
jgi:hypothetical protein